MTEKEMLDEVVEWFSADPEGRRSVTSDGACRYDPPEDKPNSKGCAIGMFISTKEDRVYLNGCGSISSILRYSKSRVPEWMLEMKPGFLQMLQDFHDIECFWTPRGLSQSGIEQVNQIRKQFKLE